MNFIQFSCLLIFLCLDSCAFILDYTKDPNEEKTVILLAFSGLPSDALHANRMPTLQQLAADGVLAIHKRSAFQTETLPVLHTLVTGRHPEKHAMMANKMRDLRDNANFDVTNKDERWWNAVEPIWISNEKRNDSKSALCFWPGHDVKFEGAQASLTCSLDRNGTKLSDPFKELTLNYAVKKPFMSMEERMAKVIEWLSMKHSPNFIAVYFEEPFLTALNHGVSSKEMDAALHRIEGLVAKLYKELAIFKQIRKVNIVITSDAAPIDFEKDKSIYLEDYLDEGLKSAYDVIDDGPIMTVSPKETSNTHVLFEKWNSSHPNMKVYTKDILPVAFHFNHENRTMPLILVAEKGWRILPRRITDPNDKRKAAIGFSAANEDTHTLLIAHGPAFRKGVRVNAIDNVDVYQMLCSALRLEANAHDGSGYILSKVVAKQDKWYWHIAKTIVESKEGLTGVIVLLIVLMFAALYLIIHAIYKTTARCNCCQNPNKEEKSIYEYNGKLNEGKMHLLAKDDDLSGSEIDEDCEINRYEVKYLTAKQT
ncbi:bis(5'-adenosyl)-triphosphatase enpp4-like [Rhopilema esculentum]|uniref:bis(5'-adenosyl)-triphosphatase enpp4-like n=1 Tax=Rhopilema esculentum TaxID=499914 RepID=UPI0031DC6F4E|eukprot:gene13575-4464_t